MSVVRVYKVGGPALEDPGLTARSPTRCAGRGGVRRPRPRRRARHRPPAEGARNRVAFRRRATRDLARGDGRGRDGPVGPRQQGPRRGPHRGRRPRGRPLGPRRRPRSAPGSSRTSAGSASPTASTSRRSRALWNGGFLPVVSPVANGPPGESRQRQRRRGCARHRARRRSDDGSSTSPTSTACGSTSAPWRRSRRRRCSARIDDGTITGGMALKVRVALAASAAGIPEVVIAGQGPSPRRVPGHADRRRGVTGRQDHDARTAGRERDDYDDDGALPTSTTATSSW